MENIFHLINGYLRYVLPPGHDYLNSMTIEVSEYLSGDAFRSAFYEKAVFDQDLIKHYSDTLLIYFSALTEFFRVNSPKYIHVLAGLSNNEEFTSYTAGRYLLSTRMMTEFYLGIKAFNNEVGKIGTVPLFDPERDCFEKIIEFELNSPSTIYFSFSFKTQQLEDMLEAKGDVKLYVYDEIEDFKYSKVLEALKKRFL